PGATGTRGDNAAGFAPQPRTLRISSGCEYHTAIFAAFQLEVAGCQPEVDSTRRKVETFLDSTTHRKLWVGFPSFFVFHYNLQSLFRMRVPNARLLRGIRRPTTGSSKLANQWTEEIHAPFRHNNIHGHAYHYRQGSHPTHPAVVPLHRGHPLGR